MDSKRERSSFTAVVGSEKGKKNEALASETQNIVSKKFICVPGWAGISDSSFLSSASKGDTKGLWKKNMKTGTIHKRRRFLNFII